MYSRLFFVSSFSWLKIIVRDSGLKMLSEDERRSDLSTTIRTGFFPCHSRVVRNGLSLSAVFVPTIAACSSLRHLCTSLRDHSFVSHASSLLLKFSGVMNPSLL